MRQLLSVLVLVFASQVFAAGTTGYVCDSNAIKKIKEGNVLELKSSAVAYLTLVQVSEIASVNCSKAALDTTNMSSAEVTVQMMRIVEACRIQAEISRLQNELRPCITEGEKYIQSHQ